MFGNQPFQEHPSLLGKSQRIGCLGSLTLEVTHQVVDRAQTCLVNQYSWMRLVELARRCSAIGEGFEKPGRAVRLFAGAGAQFAELKSELVGLIRQSGVFSSNGVVELDGLVIKRQCFVELACLAMIRPAALAYAVAKAIRGSRGAKASAASCNSSSSTRSIESSASSGWSCRD